MWYQGLSAGMRSALVSSLKTPPVLSQAYKTNLTPVNLKIFGYQVPTKVNGVPRQVYTTGNKYFANMNNKTYEVQLVGNISKGLFTQRGPVLKRVVLDNNKTTSVNGKNVNVYTPDNGQTFVANVNGKSWIVKLQNSMMGTFVKGLTATAAIGSQVFKPPNLGPAYRTRSGGVPARSHIAFIYRLSQRS